MPESYGLGDPAHGFEPMTWEWVVGKMAGARSYWVATARSDGPPHVVPVWGVWVDERFWFFTDRGSFKARNAERDPRATVNLESGDEVVILEGTLVAVTETGVSQPVSAGVRGEVRRGRGPRMTLRPCSTCPTGRWRCVQVWAMR